MKILSLLRSSKLLIKINIDTLVFLFIFSFLLFSCGEEYDLELETKKVKSFYDMMQFDLNSNIKGILVIQLDGGCTGCTGTGLNFVRENYNNPNANFIVSSSSNKIIKLKLGDQKIFMSNQILKDGQQRAQECGLIHTFPTIYYLNKGSVVEKIILDAENIDEELAEFKLKITHNVK